MARLYTFRLTSEGLAEFQKDLEQAGDKGEAALKKITDATPGLGSAMEQAAARAKQAKERLEEAAQGTSKFSEAAEIAKRVLGGFGVALGVEQVVGWGKEIFKSTALLVDQAKQLQQSTTALQAYRAAFEQSGSTADEADKVLARANAQIGNSVDNIGDARRQLSEWNLDWKQLAAAAPDQRLALIAQGLLSIEDGTRRARAEQALFGKSGHEVESVLDDMAGGVDRLTGKYKDFIVSNKDAEAAKASLNAMSESWHRLEVAASPVITTVGDGLTGWMLLLDKIAIKIGQIDWAKIDAGPDRDKIKPNPPGIPLGSLTIPNDSLNRLANLGLPPVSNLQQATDLLRQQADYARKTTEQQAIFDAQLALANAKLKDGLPDHKLAADYLGKQAVSQADIAKILTPAEQAEARRLGSIKAQGDELKKIKETYEQFLAKEQEGARLAGEGIEQRTKEAAVVQAAQVAQKASHELNVKLVETYAEAAKYLGDQKTQEVGLAEVEKLRQALAHDVLQPLQDEVALAGKTREEREQELEILRLKQQYGESAVKLSADELRNLLKQKDAMAGDDIIQQLRERVQLAGMTADQAEREGAVLDAMHATHRNLSADQAGEIRQLIQARQEAERWQSVVDGISGDFQTFFDDVLTKGKLSFGSLFDSIKGEFAQMLAWMASQALIQPIILPMVTGIMGGGPFSGATNPAAAFGGMFSPAPLGVSGLGDSLGLGAGGWFNSLGSALGFSAGGGAGSLVGLGSIAGAGGAPLSLGAISSATPALPGSLFGMSTLGSFLGGAGLGSLAGSLVFGNKNSAGLGSMGGSAIGAAIGSLPFLLPFGGPLVGGLLGGLLGGGLGSMTGTSNQGAIANFSGDGTGSYLFKQGGGNNGQMASQAANEVAAVISALKAQGVTVGMGGITGLSIGSDKSYVYDSAGGKQKLGGGDIEGVVSAVLARILPSAAGGTAEAQSVLAHYAQSGGITKDNLSQLTSDLGFANTLKDLDLSTKQLTQSEQALKQINDQYQQLIDKAAELGLSTDKIETARRAAIESLVQGFDDTVSGAIKQIQDPLGAAADALSAQQAQRIKEATALGADLTQVYALNALETKQLTDAQALQAAQQEAQAEAARKQAANFNSQMRIGIEGFTDPLQAQLDDALTQAQARLDQARQLGADLAQVEAYNALVRQKIIDDYNAQMTAAAQQAVAAASAQDAAQQAAMAQAQAQALALRQQFEEFSFNIRVGIEGFTDSLQAQLDAEDRAGQQRIDQARQLGADLAQVEQYNALTRQKIIDAYNAQMTAAAQQAADTASAQAAAQQAALVQAQAQAFALRQQLEDFNFNIRLGIEGFTDSLQSQLDAEDRAGQKRIEQARQLGADLNAVEQFNALSRQKILNDSAVQAKAAAAQQASALGAAQSGLAGLVQSLITGADSGLSPDQKYFALLTQYNQAKSAVTASPQDAALIGGYQQAASALVPFAHEFLGTSQSYGRLTGDILSTATQLGGDLADPSGIGRAMVNATVSGSGAIVDALGLTNDRLDTLGQDFKRLSAVVQAILNRSAA